MCTVAVLPDDGGYLLGHNRDESVLRSRAIPPAVRDAHGSAFLAPLDPDGGGTWLAVNDHGVCVCLLNAAEGAPRRFAAVPPSRGLIALGLADASSIVEIERRLTGDARRLDGTRAFHLVAVETGADSGGVDIVRFRWDGAKLETDRLAAPALFVSNLRHQDEAETERVKSWRRFLEATPEPDRGRLAGWLSNHDPHKSSLSACMHRAEARTVSRTVVRVTITSIALDYTDGSPCNPAAPETTLHLPMAQSR